MQALFVSGGAKRSVCLAALSARLVYLSGDPLAQRTTMTISCLEFCCKAQSGFSLLNAKGFVEISSLRHKNLIFV